ncbi:MAG TPA: glycosyltransferase family 4 protein [Vicinamibacterales bacterium]|nr:glycosyltransferase family 4 protein [Vicinamibacterales bacterium]
MASPTLAAVTLHESGGGVASVSRLIWQVMGDTWGDRRRLITLGNAPAYPARRRRPSIAGRAAFGLRLAASQAAHPDGWVFFTHLSLARAQRYVPAMLRRQYAVFLHGIEAWRTLNADEQEILHGAALRVANSRYTASAIAAANPGLGSIEICPLAFAPVDAPSQVKRPCAETPDVGPRAVLLVGRMDAGERYKGHDELLEVWPRVVASTPDARLVFAGDGDDRARLLAKAAALGVASHVIFTGFLPTDGLACLYNSAAVFAMPSRGEGFGLVYLEAMAHGLPCIGSTHDAAREVIDDGATGYLVDQADGHALADRVTKLLVDENLRRRLGAAGRRRVAEQFSYRQFSHRLVDLVRRSLSTDAVGLPSVSRALD